MRTLFTLTVPTGIDLAGGKVTFTVPSVEIYALAAFE